MNIATNRFGLVALQIFKYLRRRVTGDMDCMELMVVAGIIRNEFRMELEDYSLCTGESR